MSVYYQILLWFAAFASLQLFISVKHSEIVLGKRQKRYQPIYAFAVMIPLLYYAANRRYVGDTEVYRRTWSEMPTAFSELSAYMETVTRDRGFYYISALIKTTISSRDVIYFGIIAAIQIIILVMVYRKYSSEYMMSMFLFLASSDYISWIFNGMRQFLAVVLTFATCALILKKKYIPAILIILLASTIHGTALLMLPFIFVVQGKAWNKKTLLFIIAVIVVVSFVGQFTDILDNMLQETQYENVVSDWKEWGDDGTNILRVLVYSVPTILSLIGYRYIKAADDPIINMAVNMSIISTGFYVVSMFTSGIFIGRLPIYFSLYNYILLPWEIDHIFEKKSADFVKLVMIVAYLGFYYIAIRGFGLLG